VNSIAQCLDILEALDRSNPTEAGMVERLKRLLGLKPRLARARETASSVAAPESSPATRLAP
jgi:hypothetical protein